MPAHPVKRDASVGYYDFARVDHEVKLTGITRLVLSHRDVSAINTAGSGIRCRRVVIGRC